MLEMSATEALRTQLNVLQTKFYVSEAENRRLRDENPERAETVDLERELRETQENIRLAQQLSEAGEVCGDCGDASTTAIDELRESHASLQQEVEEFRQ